MKVGKGTNPKKEWHSSSSKIGMGDFYGSGIKQNVGRVRVDYLNNPSPSKKSIKRPKSLA